MPQAVSQVATPSAKRLTWGGSTTRSQGDSESFSDALDRAQGSDAGNTLESSSPTPKSERAMRSKANKPSESQETSSEDGSSEEDTSVEANKGESTDPPDSTTAEGGRDVRQANGGHSQPAGPTKNQKTPKPATAELQESKLANAAPTSGVQSPAQPPEPSQPEAASDSSPVKKVGKKASPVVKKVVTAASAVTANPAADAPAPAPEGSDIPTSAASSAPQAQSGDVSPVGKARLAVQPQVSTDPTSSNDANAARAVSDPALPSSPQETSADLNLADDSALVDATPASTKTDTSQPENDETTLVAGANQIPAGVHQAQAPAASASHPSAVPEARFADNNHPEIVSGIQGKLLPNGGSMHIRLDPPELGALNVHVSMKDGVMTASFETSNDQASKLLSHSLSDLKTALEAQGVSVEKLHVTQSPRQQSSSSRDSSQRNPDADSNSAHQQEQQRKEMLRRMWRKLSNGQDPLDLVA